MRKRSVRVVVVLLVLVATAALGGYEVGRAQTTGEDAVTKGLFKAMTNIVATLTGETETAYFAFESTSTLTPSVPLKPDTTFKMEVNEDSAVQLHVNVIRPGDGTSENQARLVYQVQIGRGEFRLVTNEAEVPAPVRDPRLDSYRPVISPTPRPDGAASSEP